MNILKYMKSHWKLEEFYSSKTNGNTKARLRRALKKKAMRELLNDINKS